MPSTKHQRAGGGRSRAPLLLLLLFLISSLVPQPIQGAIHVPDSYKISNLKKPPTITAQPKSYTAFPVDDIILVCNASGNPPPTFRWTRNGTRFDPIADPGTSVSNNSGTFTVVASDPVEQYRGRYRCYAANELGTAVSDEARLIIENNPTLPKEKKVKISVEEGHSVVLNCNPPFSSAPPQIHWMDKDLKHIQLSERVTTGLDGSLYFANVNASDSRSDYSCNPHYTNARTILPMEPISLTVIPSNAVVSNRKPSLLSPSTGRSSHLALRGKSLVLECIPEGHPTPTVQWVRKDGTLSASRTSKQNHGMWLSFAEISENDDGEYECQATNLMGVAKHSFTVTVEAAPHWTKQPESQLYAPGETVRLHCEASGIPTPSISWSMNGDPISGIDQDSRRRVHGGTIILKEVKFEDTAVYQCQASNKHGTILVNAFIHVIMLPPQILTKDEEVYKVTEGQTAALKCNTFGSPRPKVTWDSPSWDSVLSNPRMSILTTGVLQVNNTSMEDAGLYTCSVLNSNLSITAQLQVFNRSVIQPLPESQRVRSGQLVTITCHARIDAQLKIVQRQWRKGRQKLMESSENKYTFDGPSLMISDIQSEDEGKYTCEVITNLDMADATVSIIVMDRPDPPKNLQVIEHPDPERLTVRWTPGDHHNSPIEAFIVEVEEQRFGKGEWVKEKRVKGDVAQADLHLHPFCIYRVQVKAINGLGESDPAESPELYEMPAAAPSGSPENVQSESIDPDTLVITWKEMDRLSFNGPKFKYKVMWKRQADKGAPWEHAEVDKPPFVVKDAGTYTPFMVKVQAVNEMGAGPAPPEVTMHSGEDIPTAAPSDIRVEPMVSADRLTSLVQVKWAAVHPETVRGHLLGYKIHLQRLGVRGNGVGHMKRGKRERREREREREQESNTTVEVKGPKEEVLLEDLRLYSNYIVSIAAYNSKGEGPYSTPESFSTPEGKPEPPASLKFTSPTETELTLHWTPPAQLNGVLQGYLLQYQEIVSSNDSPLQVVTIEDPSASHFTLQSLNPQSWYRFYLRGRTVAGDGDAITKDAATLLDGVPPSNISTSVGETYVNLSWVPGERHRNVEFHIQYQRNNGGSEKIFKTVNSIESFHKIDDLKPGTHYNFTIIFSNKTHWAKEIKTEGPGLSEVQGGFATQGWFIGLISAIVLLLLILLILCFIKRSKGGKYSVKDKEEGQVDSEARPMKDDTFGEYRSLESDNEEKRTPSQPSLCVESKLGSDDSLAEYGDSVDIQFNEDGSFIGQYSGHRDGPGPGGPDSSGATSPVNPSAMVPPGMGHPNSINLMGRGN
ncbi:neural cell adhesion molecule L1-like isoform X1 [Anguilla rostrata]|uniref:neural cell adhesion molecule L1-like isoform X1 n=1 Tax=Anguilla rostrata TaxID=7938 RepID=UPI0030D6104A